MPDEPKLLYREVMRLRWGEMDAMRHLNNVSYFRYFEEGRIAWFRSTGIAAHDSVEGAVLGTISCRFIRSAVYPADVVVELRAGRVGNASFTLFHAMRDAADPALIYADGEAVMVWIDSATGRSRPLPGGIRAALGGAA
ncbi:MAG: thioesterase family protein [Betaproteobacteria bacterium]|jgi:acyl-CoA thioester hydrolase